jgi:shikimate kinase
VLDGPTLFRAQAAGQARLLLDREPDPTVLDAALAARSNLVLVGLRGAGKTTVGRQVARRLGRPFVDTDEEVARISGRSPARWIRDEGIEAFRDREAEVVARLAGRRGIVVAAGAGATERKANAAAFARLGFVAWLRLDPETAAARVAADPTDRPRLLADGDAVSEARRLAAWREATWRRLADLVVDASASPEAAAEQVTNAWLSFLLGRADGTGVDGSD